jgi:deazaflavin-dependent oxidoreductase (nitroreductase family)
LLVTFQAPTTVERIFNSVFGFLIGIGVAPSNKFLLQVRGRKSGKLFSTPINQLEFAGKLFLVAPRGQTQWVRNAEAANEIRLRKGSSRSKFRLRPLQGQEKFEVLKVYLDTFPREVQTYFPVRAGSPLEAFVGIADNYPAFELISL